MEDFEWKKLKSARMSGVKRNICTLKELLEEYRAAGCPVEKRDACGRKRIHQNMLKASERKSSGTPFDIIELFKNIEEQSDKERLGGRWWVWAEKCKIVPLGKNLRAQPPALGTVTLNSDGFLHTVVKTPGKEIPQPLWATCSMPNYLHAIKILSVHPVGI